MNNKVYGRITKKTTPRIRILKLANYKMLQESKKCHSRDVNEFVDIIVASLHVFVVYEPF